MKDEIVQKHLKRLQNLRQYKEISKEELLRIAKKKANEELADIDNLVTDIKEKKLAKKLLNKYLDDFDINNVSDRNDLNVLIFLEIVHVRLLTLLNDKAADADGAVPLHTLDAVHKNVEKMSELKTKLGLTSGKGEQDPLKVLDELKESAYTYITDPENRDRFEMKCPTCGEITLLWRETKDFKIVKHPLILRGTTLYNKGLFDLVRKKKITAKELSDAFEVISEDYVNWCIEHIKE